MNLTPEQEKFVQAGPKCVLQACAGSGKTTALVARIRADIEAGVDAASAVALTFTVEAGRVLHERLTAAGVRLGYVGTLHGWLWREYRARHPGTVLLGENQASQLWWQQMQQLRFRWTIEQAEKFKRDPSLHVESRLVSKAYRNEIEAAGVICLDSLLWVRDWSDLCVSALWVDEVQDSAAVDQEIYDAIKSPIKVYVGDARQSIYGFRGANPSWIDATAKSGFHVLKLTVNFRSLSGICELANAIGGGKMRAHREGEAMLMDKVVHDEHEEATVIKVAVQPSPGEWAVLCRYNYLAAFVRARLLADGVPVQDSPQPVDVDAPHLRRLRALAALLADDSQRAREAYLREQYGVAFAAKARASADAAQQPIQLGFEIPRKISQQSMATLAMAAKLGSLETDMLIEAVKRSDNPVDWQMDFAAPWREPQTKGSGVWIGTIHAAKGREWPNVIVAGLDLMPDRRGDIAEETRLMYVAATRAKDKLMLTSAKFRRQKPSRAPIWKTT